jgi:hypothetical protein
MEREEAPVKLLKVPAGQSVEFVAGGVQYDPDGHKTLTLVEGQKKVGGHDKQDAEELEPVVEL